MRIDLETIRQFAPWPKTRWPLLFISQFDKCSNFITGHTKIQGDNDAKDGL